jgi:cytochrome o ubiquinol oxidase subunit II
MQRFGSTAVGVTRRASHLCCALLLTGCSGLAGPDHGAMGPISGSARELLFIAAGLMLVVVVPVYVMAIAFLWRYRASNAKADYAPDWAYSPRVDAVVWTVPALIVAVLGTLVWSYTHKLDPYRPLAGDGPPLLIQAIALDWKWVFIYPEAGVAAVNELVIPRGRPVTLAITSDTVMNSLFIPALAGQIYAMAGMETRLNIRADRAGVFPGRNTQYSGAGFADQHFAVRAVDAPAYADWIAALRAAPLRLDAAAYAELAEPSRAVPVTHYTDPLPRLFEDVIGKYAGHAGHR